MWKLWRKKSASEADERTFPAEKEFWLVRGAFREWQADRSGQGYYGLCDCSTEAVCPPGERPRQDRFYRLVYDLTKRMLQSALQTAGVGQRRHGSGRNGQVEGLLCVRVSRHAGFILARHLLVDGGAWVRGGSLRAVQRVGARGRGGCDRLRTQRKDALRHFDG